MQKGMHCRHVVLSTFWVYFCTIIYFLLCMGWYHTEVILLTFVYKFTYTVLCLVFAHVLFDFDNTVFCNIFLYLVLIDFPYLTSICLYSTFKHLLFFACIKIRGETWFIHVFYPRRIHGFILRRLEDISVLNFFNLTYAKTNFRWPFLNNGNNELLCDKGSWIRT